MQVSTCLQSLDKGDLFPEWDRGLKYIPRLQFAALAASWAPQPSPVHAERFGVDISKPGQDDSSHVSRAGAKKDGALSKGQGLLQVWQDRDQSPACPPPPGFQWAFILKSSGPSSKYSNFPGRHRNSAQSGLDVASSGFSMIMARRGSSPLNRVQSAKAEITLPKLCPVVRHKSPKAGVCICTA